MKFKVLFVDDEENIISGLKRMMHPMKKQWDVFFANSGKRALEILEKQKIDVIISDIRMPGIDGTQLLTKVKEEYPQIVRITLSGYSDENLALKNTRIVHQSLAKPTNSTAIKETIERAFSLREKLNNEALLKTINGINQLPSLPEIYLKLEKEINIHDSSIDKIANIISDDPIITAKILQLTNSAFFGLPIKISNIKQALNYLGISIIQTLVLTIKLFKSIDSKNPNAGLYQKIFNHSQNVAFWAKKLSELKNSSNEITEETFLSGLLHDIGKLIVLEGIENNNIKTENDFLKYEKNNFKTTHAEIGAYLLGIWGLPDSIVEAVAFHHYKNLQNFNSDNSAKFVFIANNIVNKNNIKHDEITNDNIDIIIKDYGIDYMEEKLDNVA